MSSTGRKAAREEADNYPTPSWCVRRLLERMVALPDGHWVEPAVGEGAIVRAVEGVRSDARWTTIDVRDIPAPSVRLEAHLPEVSFLDVDPVFLRSADVVITNPPFSLAREFIERAAALAPEAYRIFLLRLNFLGSEDRHAWLSSNMPTAIYQLPNRPSFVRRKTDSVEYGWFVWAPGDGPRTWSRVELLALTSLEERKRR